MKIKTLLYFLTAILVFQSCGYEEGPMLSLRSKKARLTGKWFQATPEPSQGSTVYIEIIDDENMRTGGSYTLRGEVKNYFSNGTWEWADDKKQVKLIWGPVDQATFSIHRLTNSELWFKYVGDDELYKYEKE